MVVITAYRVCDANINTIGASTAYHQQWHMLRNKGYENPKPRKQFVIDLELEIRKWQRTGADIILGGDFNETLGDTPEGIAQLVTRCSLTDLHTSNHGLAGEPSTYSRGSKRLDYDFISPRVLSFLKKMRNRPLSSDSIPGPPRPIPRHRYQRTHPGRRTCANTITQIKRRI